MADYIQSRNEARIMEVVNTLIVSGEIKNPKLSRFASVNDISLSKDNAYATLYVSCLEDRQLQNSVTALQSAAGFIQARIARVLKTKNTPKLNFVADTTERDAARIDALLESIKQ
ncbi:MAG: 30S ribosome-binding factor RbfA [Spirochaetales bacterium]|nr:30S ribosome-binding factor RbfA [Spirochaetales bacterium]MBQ5364613.1 30S ribosome-binding factor RbfA [Spirochaetales bacterium]